MNQPPVIVKIGGASLTQKEKEETLTSEENLEIILSNISKSFHTISSRNSHLILIHGAGSFGHHCAKKYGIKSIDTPKNGNENYQQNKEGITKTRLSVLKLHLILLDYLITKLCLPAISISTYGILKYENGMIRNWGMVSDQISRSLELGLIPILHGDVIVDEKGNPFILSGDVIMLEIARRLKPSICVFLTNVAGVYKTWPPKDEKQDLIKNIQSTDKELFKENDIDCSFDVTGKMRSKLQSAFKIVDLDLNTRVFIVSALHQDAFFAITGKDIENGTEIK